MELWWSNGSRHTIWEQAAAEPSPAQPSFIILDILSWPLLVPLSPLSDNRPLQNKTPPAWCLHISCSCFQSARLKTVHCLYLSAKYLVFNQHQKKSHRAHAHKLLDCSHIHQQHSTASTAQPARISSELSARRR